MIHLVDSGGQYKQGTTDVTRAFHFGSQQHSRKMRILEFYWVILIFRDLNGLKNSKSKDAKYKY